MQAQATVPIKIDGGTKGEGPEWMSYALTAIHFSLLRGKDYLKTLRLHEKYGSVVRVSPTALSYNTAQAWRDIYALKSDRTEFVKDPNFYEKEPNILAMNQNDHARVRKLYGNAFTDTALLEQAPLLTRYFDLLIAKLKQ
ncbi:MAG: hypothetical protein Q9213_008357, partial [Squamulea squamosa]